MTTVNRRFECCKQNDYVLREKLDHANNANYQYCPTNTERTMRILKTLKTVNEKAKTQTCITEHGVRTLRTASAFRCSVVLLYKPPY